MRNPRKFLAFLAWALVGLPMAAQAAGGGKDGSPGPEIPIAIRAHVDKAPPPVPVGNSLARARCFKSSVDFDEYQFCFVVKYDGLTYWPLSFDDNRMAVLLAGYDESGRLARKVYACGTRYIWYITVNQDKQTVILWGQGPNPSASNPTGGAQDPSTAAVPWQMLRDGGETCPSH